VQPENRIDKYITGLLRQRGDVPLKLLRKLGFVNAAVLSGLRAVLYSSGEQVGRCWKQSSKIVREQETWIIERQAGRQAGWQAQVLKKSSRLNCTHLENYYRHRERAGRNGG
jgi:hypothetical protein